MEINQPGLLDRNNHVCSQPIDEITAFDRLTFGQVRGPVDEATPDVAYLSKINKLRGDLVCPSTALY